MNNIVLTSQKIGCADGFNIHGIFPCFVSAVRHMAKDENMTDYLLEYIIQEVSECKVSFEFTRPQLDGSEVHWCASVQPIRNELGL